MAIFAMVLGLIATYLPAVAGARGRGSRGLWIGCIFIGLFVVFAGIWIGNALYGANAQNVLMSSHGVNVLALTIRTACGFSLGSFLASLLIRKKQPVNQLGLR